MELQQILLTGIMRIRMLTCDMAKTLQIRDVSDQTYGALRRNAANAGMTLQKYLRRELDRAAERPTLEEWLERTRRRHSDTRTEEVLATLDEMRGPWPDADS
ncbi:MAG TPA: hypothetical protein VG815_06915 [Chloroflexota bacterium]|nr:hypothetical protein [Chloroflexota bacterium]